MFGAQQAHGLDQLIGGVAVVEIGEQDDQAAVAGQVTDLQDAGQRVGFARDAGQRLQGAAQGLQAGMAAQAF